MQQRSDFASPYARRPGTSTPATRTRGRPLSFLSHLGFEALTLHRTVITNRYKLTEPRVVLIWFEASGRPRVRQVRCGPHRRYLALFVGVPAGAVVRENGAVELGVQPILEVLVRGPTHLEPGQSFALLVLNRLADIGRLPFQQEHDRVGDAVGIWPEQHEHIREVGNGHAQVRRGAARPLLVQIDATTPANLDGSEELAGLEPSAPDDDVGIDMATVSCDYSGLVDRVDGRADQVDIVSTDRRIPIVGQKQTIARSR